MFPISALTISNIQPGFTGNWECRVRTSRGNTTRTVHIVVLETSAKYCAPERVTNNRGEFKLVCTHIKQTELLTYSSGIKSQVQL